MQREIVEPISSDDLFVTDNLPVCRSRQKQARERVRRNDVLVRVAVVRM